jgi:hypothetical protein
MFFAAKPSDSPYADALDPEPRLGVQFDAKGRIGIVMLKERDPADERKFKRLTFDDKGSTNNTCVLINDHEYLFGNTLHGRWLRRDARLPDRHGWESAFLFPKEDVLLLQRVELIVGEQTRLIDTCLVRYTIENRSRKPNTVGLRVLLDTFIGANDGVPFIIPGQRGLLDTLRVFPQKEIPDYIQALEQPDLKSPGTVAHLGLKVPDAEPVQRLVIARWPQNTEVRWDWPLEAMNADAKKKDSSVALYWATEKMEPGEKRQMAFTYGLNAISVGDANLGLTAGGDFRPAGDFTLTAYVKNPQPDQVVRLTLPEGLRLAEGEEVEKGVEPGREFTQVSWRIHAEAAGDYTVKATSGLDSAVYKVRIRARRLY